MAKKIIVVPPQSVSVNVSVNVGTGQTTPAPAQHGHIPAQAFPSPVPQHQPVQVNTGVAVGTAPPWGVVPAAAPTGPYTPPFTMPTSDLLRRKVPMLARRTSLGLGDHVHTPVCAESGCPLLAASVQPRPATRPWSVLGWMLVALVVWCVQYGFVVPLAYLGAVAQSGIGRAIGWFAILLCGFGPFFSLFYLCSPAVPRSALRPWGLNALH
jgi:hypothetical protein